MDYYQGVVADYFRHEKFRFVSPEFLIDIGDGKPHAKGCSWWVDVLAVDFKHQSLWLCEVSYPKTLSALIRRLKQWSDNWDAVCVSLKKDTQVPETWDVKPWCFVPGNLIQAYKNKFAALTPVRFEPDITALEETPPWKYTVTTVADAAKIAELASNPD